MSTSHAGGRAPGVLDRLTDWVLDHDGDIYGQDERERYRWYEGIALAASAQWILVPWTMAALVWFADRDAAILLAVAFAVFHLGLLPANLHVRRKRVEVHPVHWSRKRILISAVAIPAGPVFFLGFMRAFAGMDATEAVGATVGGVIGLAGGVAFVAVRSRIRARRAAAGADAEMD
ncbi:MAG: hypothetical protein U0237_12945 [Thermoleophilia bacterium]